MYILDDLTFIAHPRTASRACAAALLTAGAQAVGEDKYSDTHHGMNVSRLTSRVVCVKRNMFDVLVSWWHNQNRKPGTDEPLNANAKDFGVYVYEKAYRTTHRWFLEPIYHYGIVHSDVVIAYEDLQAGINNMFKAMGLPAPQLAKIGASKRTEYRDYYTPATRAIVEDRWAQDLKITGYSF